MVLSHLCSGEIEFVLPVSNSSRDYVIISLMSLALDVYVNSNTETVPKVVACIVTEGSHSCPLNMDTNVSVCKIRKAIYDRSTS